jgi:DNA invertase Pin-like site-specific DNA recombinase
MHAYRRCLAYARVSSAKQDSHGTSLPDQEERFRAYCAANKLPAPIIYTEVESASSEKIERRTELARLLRDAQPGDVVLALYVDRWSRDLPYGVSTRRPR